jgi:molybdopterin-containing oxidoreductase family membrane subunit
MSVIVSGVFPFKDKLISAIRRLKKEGLSDMEVRMPVPDHDILDEISHKPTLVGFFTLFGGLAGLFTGFFGPAWAHSHWGNIIGGKPVISLPAFLVIMFELMILFGAAATLIGLFLLCRLPNTKFSKDTYHDARVTEDHYLLMVDAPDDKVESVKAVMGDEGAEVRP